MVGGLVLLLRAVENDSIRSLTLSGFLLGLAFLNEATWCSFCGRGGSLSLHQPPKAATAPLGTNPWALRDLRSGSRAALLADLPDPMDGRSFRRILVLDRQLCAKICNADSTGSSVGRVHQTRFAGVRRHTDAVGAGGSRSNRSLLGSERPTTVALYGAVRSVFLFGHLSGLFLSCALFRLDPARPSADDRCGDQRSWQPLGENPHAQAAVQHDDWTGGQLPCCVGDSCRGNSYSGRRLRRFARTTYSLNPFPESLEIAKIIKASTSSRDRIAVLGSEPQIFFYSNRRSATGHIYTYALMEDHGPREIDAGGDDSGNRSV